MISSGPKIIENNLNCLHDWLKNLFLHENIMPFTVNIRHPLVSPFHRFYLLVLINLKILICNICISISQLFQSTILLPERSVLLFSFHILSCSNF